ncbi:MAG: GWxTD domain-containing protein [Acidobacteria bacterium RIFCSPLOWO2_02_FULL_59_13]|nr:MAG: GWxTD domain-containing protein [Acidobacteria bacterium RIFCSPLOWO2_02_FULL_59_13]
MGREGLLGFLAFFLSFILLVFRPQALWAQAAPETSSESELVQQSEAPGVSDKERERRQESLERELAGAFRRWLNEDVTYIITDEERNVFKSLQNDEEREQFIEQFWLRRAPDPESMDNEYKEEHYRRIAYANQHFASGIPGWKADRGRIYIMYGPPDEIEAHPSGGHYERPIEEGGGSTSTFPFEVWRYRYIEGVAQNVELEFVDPTLTGEYRLTIDPSEKDALLNVPGAGLSMMEEMGLSSKVDRFTRTDGTRMPKRMIDSSPGAGYATSTRYGGQFDRLALLANIHRPPVVKFKDLEELVVTNIRFNTLPFQVRADYIKVTEDTILSALTVGLLNKDLAFQNSDGVHRAAVNIFGRITTLTRRVVQTFEDTISLDIPESLLQESLKKPSVYWKSIPLRPGLYRLSLALKDIHSGNVGTLEFRMEVPRFEEDQLATSSLIVADLIEKVPTRRIGLGQFVIGDTKVRPAVEESFARDQKLGIYMQVYNLKPTPNGNKPAGKIHYALLKGNQPVLEFEENTETIPDASPSQVVVEKMMPLASLEPGRYTLKITVTDLVTQKSVSPSTEFVVR